MTSAPLARALVSVAGLMLLFGAAGCASVGAEAFDDEGEVSLLKVDAPLREPTWVGPENTLLALKADEPKVVKIDTGAEVPAGEAPPASDEGAVVASERLESAGENFATYLRKPEQVYVPQPGRRAERGGSQRGGGPGVRRRPAGRGVDPGGL